MKKVLLGLMALAASGCTTLQTGADLAGATLCARADSARQGYLITIQNALFIADPVIRTMVIGSAQAGLDALAQCPGYVPPVSGPGGL